MGADVIIAVDASPPLLERDRLRTVLGISEQVVTLLGRQDLESEMESADVALDLGFEDVGIFDFRDADSIIARGTAVARDSARALSAWSLPRPSTGATAPRSTSGAGACRRVRRARRSRRPTGSTSGWSLRASIPGS